MFLTGISRKPRNEVKVTRLVILFISDRKGLSIKQVPGASSGQENVSSWGRDTWVQSVAPCPNSVTLQHSLNSDELYFPNLCQWDEELPWGILRTQGSGEDMPQRSRSPSGEPERAVGWQGLVLQSLFARHFQVPR